jgi:hypothetical protein
MKTEGFYKLSVKDRGRKIMAEAGLIDEAGLGSLTIHFRLRSLTRWPRMCWALSKWKA